MWEKLKALPMFVKVIIGFFVGINAIGLVFMAIAPNPSPSPNPNPNPQPPQNQGQQVVYPNGYNPQQEVNPPTPNNGGGQGGELANYKLQLAKVTAAGNDCIQQLQQFQQQEQQAAISSGGMSMGNVMEPACEQNMNQWIYQGLILQTRITRLETGNPNITVCQANPGVRGCEGVQLASGAGSSSSGGGNSDDAGRYDRQAIRGNTIYTDEEGGTHELPTASYYFKDKVTGEFVASQYPTPPNNTHTYEQMTPEN